MSSKIGHPYHLVHPSPWPLLAAIRALGMTGGFIVIFHSKDYTIFFLSIFSICLVLFQWWGEARGGEEVRVGKAKNVISFSLLLLELRRARTTATIITSHHKIIIGERMKSSSSLLKCHTIICFRINKLKAYKYIILPAPTIANIIKSKLMPMTMMRCLFSFCLIP